MGVDLDVMFAATVTAEEAFALPERLARSPGVLAACRYYDERLPCRGSRNAPDEWTWNEYWPTITSPSVIVEGWLAPYLGSLALSCTPGLLWINPNQITLSAGPKLSGFAMDYEGCQDPIRRVCRALAQELGTDRVLYLPDSGDWPPEVGDTYNTRFDDVLARLTAWGPPVPTIAMLA